MLLIFCQIDLGNEDGWNECIAIGGQRALIPLSGPSPIPLRETGEGANDYGLRPFAPLQMGEGPDRGMRALHL